MQIGTRWRVGEQIPAAVPALFADGLRAAQTAAGLTDGVWLLTWLEGRPVADHSGGMHLVADAQGRAVESVASADTAGVELDDEDWL